MTEIINISGGKIVGVRTSVFTIFNQERYDSQAIPTAWQDFFEKSEGMDLGHVEMFYGAAVPSMSLEVPMDYFAGALVSLECAVPGGMESVEIPRGLYLAVTHLGPISTIADSYQKAYMESLGASGREMRSAPHLEIYMPNLNPMADDYEMKICIPVN